MAGLHRSEGAENATRIYAGIYLHDVTKFEQRDGVFDADFEFWVKWRGGFNPDHLIIANASDVELEPLGEETDGDWHTRRWRVRGTLRGEFPVHKFPFDEQTLSVVFELPQRFGQLVPDLAGSGMRERFSVAGWLYRPVFSPRIDTEVYRSDLGAIDGEGLPTSVSRAAFEVTLRRPLVTAATKLFLPLVVILLVAFVALFVHPKRLEVRSSVGVTALLACFAFHFAVSDSMPHVTYITLAEMLFLVSYGVCAVLLCVSVAAAAMHDRGLKTGYLSLDRVTLVALPIVVAATAFFTVPSAPKAQAVPSAPKPAVASDRPESTRKVLRIGVNTLSRVSGGLVGRAASWGTIRTPFQEEAFPVLVEEVPAITNNSLRFLADGRLEVTWRLLPNLRWSDGAPLTAQDLAFALEVSPDARIDHTRVVSPEELVVCYKERVAVALQEIVPLPRHVLLPAFSEGGYDAVRKYRDENILPSSGAYKVTDWKADDYAVLEANPHFAGPPPSIPRIELLYYKEEDLVKAFEAGEIDMIAPNSVSPEAAQTFARKRKEAVSVRPSDLLLFLHPDLSNPMLAQREVRRALLMSFNRTEMRNAIFGEASSSAPIAHIPVPGPLPAGAKEIRHDLRTARAEFERLGLVGARIQLMHGPKKFDLAVVDHLVRDAAAAGLILEPRQVDDPSREYRNPKHGGLLLITRTGLRDDEPEKYWNVPRLASIYDRTYRSEAFDDSIAMLVHREERALYPERREQIRDMLFAEFSERLPLLPLCFMADLTVVDPHLKGWEIGSGKNFGMNIERWHFADPMEGESPATP